MECVIFIGMQATGKSSFYRERFFNTHIRINRDMLKTQHRERLLLDACINAKQSFVLDNTNVTRIARAHVITTAKAAGFRIAGFYFASKLAEAMRRNALREGAARIPDVGLLGTHARLELPRLEEGFDALNYVRLNDGIGFTTEDWKDEI